MLILKILDHDLHRSKSDVPFIGRIEIPAHSKFLPSIVSSTRGNFLTVRKLIDNSRIGVGVFEYDSEKMDAIIPSMLGAARQLSIEEKWENVFSNRKQIERAFSYIVKKSHLPAQPHVCLVMSDLSTDQINEIFGDQPKYNKYCRVIPIPKQDSSLPNFAAFLSKPDMVGLYTRFLGGPAAILLHNIRRGMSFCDL